jgi:hypothetical protein
MSSCVDKLKERKRLAERSAEDDSEVEVNWTASGDLEEVLAEYADYMRREMPHVNRISAIEISKLVTLIEKLDNKEMDKKWRFEFPDAQRWGGHVDEVLRALVPSSCRGDEWRKLNDYVRTEMNGCAHLQQVQREDIAIYGFIRCIVADAFEVKSKDVFGLCNDAFEVCILLDSCCFNPREKGGDTLFLDIKLIAERSAIIRSVFPGKALAIQGRGAFENLMGNSMDDEDMEDEEGELDSEDDDDSDFVVGDDVVD